MGGLKGSYDTFIRVDVQTAVYSEMLREYELAFVSKIAKFIVPDWGDKVDSGIGLSYRPAGLHRLTGRYDYPMPESTISPIQGL